MKARVLREPVRGWNNPVWAWSVLVALSASARADSIDDYLQAECQRQKIPGMAVGVMRNGKLTYARAFGLANLETRTPATPQTVFYLASVTKQFVAAGIMILVQDGKLLVEDAIIKHLPELPESWQDLKVSHLLNMTSGLRREVPDWSPLKPFTDEEILKLIASAPLEAKPGERYAYSNAGYFLLGILIKRVSGLNWWEFLGQRIFEPLGMKSTRVMNHYDLIPNRASSYELRGSDWKNSGPILSVRASGGILSTVEDMARWDAALYGEEILKESSKAIMWTATRLNDGREQQYGFGWSLGKQQEHRVIEHGGALLGFRTHFARYIEAGLSVVILSNGSTARPAEIAHGVAERIWTQ